MKERPILFTGEMVKAILEGRKTQTRRVVKPTMTTPKVAPLRMEPWLIDDEQETDDKGLPCWVGYHPDYPGDAKWFTCPYGKAGDRLWVRETFSQIHGQILYRADHDMTVPGFKDEDGEDREGVWKPSIFMPRDLSRITLEITDVRVERVQQISTADACAEGIGGCRDHLENVHAVTMFHALWDSINLKRGYSWQSNPWVWVLTLKLQEEKI